MMPVFILANNRYAMSDASVEPPRKKIKLDPQAKQNVQDEHSPARTRDEVPPPKRRRLNSDDWMYYID